jgi:hypothetical protein
MLALEKFDETTIENGMSPTMREVYGFIPAVVE